MKHGAHGDVSVTYENNRTFLSTCGINLNQISDMAYREELLKLLIPMQKAVDGSEEIDENEGESSQFGMNMSL